MKFFSVVNYFSFYTTTEYSHSKLKDEIKIYNLSEDCLKDRSLSDLHKVVIYLELLLVVIENDLMVF